MYNNKNKNTNIKTPLYFIFLSVIMWSSFYCFKPLDQLLTFSVDGNIFSALQKACKDKNINIGILTNRNITFVGNFHEIPLKQLFKIIFDDHSMEVNTVGSFVIIKDAEAYTKVYEIHVALNGDQKKSVESFLGNFTKNQKNCFYVYNTEDGTIVYTGLKNTHDVIENYINKLNAYYGEQVVLECKIIAISHNKTNSTVNFLDLVGNLLGIFRDYEKNKSIPGAFLNIIGKCDNKDEIEFITRYLSAHYRVNNIQEIQILLRNKQITSFQNGETRYADKVYDHRIIPIESTTNSDRHKYTNTVLKNVKELKAGMNLKMEATIIKSGVLLTLNYNQSSFRNKIAHQLPEIVESALETSIHIIYDKVIVLNGLKTTIYSKKIKNKSKFFLWRWLFEKTEGEEIECQIIFLIRVKKV